MSWLPHLFTEMPRASILGNPHSATRILIQWDRGNKPFRARLRPVVEASCYALGWIFTERTRRTDATN